MDLWVGVLLSAVVAWLVAHAVRLARFSYRLWKVPTCEVYEFDWLSGHLNGFLDRSKHLHETVPRMRKAHYRIHRVMIGPFLPVARISVSHPETIGPILKQSSPKDMLIYGLLLPFIGDGLLLSSGKKWARDRRLLTNAFHFNILQEYTPKLQESCSVFLEKLHQHAQHLETASVPYDFSQACCLLSMDVILRCIMGLESNCQVEDLEYTKGVRSITELIFQRANCLAFFLPDWLYFLTASGKEMKGLCDMCHEYTRSIITNRRQKLFEDGCMEKGCSVYETLRNMKKGEVDFLDILLTVRDEDGSGLSDSEICDQVDTFLFEGHDTTASGMQWMFYFLAKHPDVQQKCREEAQQYASNSGTISHDSLGKLTFITQCIKESLRMACPVPEILRELVEDTEVDGYLLPRRTTISVFIFSLHHCPEIYPDPYKFNPDRFSEENSRDRHPLAFVPFSAGPRNCIGQALAMNELRCTLAHVLMHFELSLDKSLPEPLYMDGIVMRGSHPIKLLVKEL